VTYVCMQQGGVGDTTKQCCVAVVSKLVREDDSKLSHDSSSMWG
jgi:hypothetical protein